MILRIIKLCICEYSSFHRRITNDVNLTDFFFTFSFSDGQKSPAAPLQCELCSIIASDLFISLATRQKKTQPAHDSHWKK